MNTRTWLWMLLLAALAVRVGWCWSRPVDEAAMAKSLPDQWEYLQIGRHALSGQGFSFFDFRFQQRVVAFRMPGYPAFIALCGGGVRAVQMAQCALDASTVLATFLLARRWLSSRASLLAAAAVAVNPFLIFFCALILSETLFTGMLIWGMALLSGRCRLGAPLAVQPASQRHSHRHIASNAMVLIGVLLLAIAVLVRPSALGLPALLAGAAMFAARAAVPRVVAAAAVGLAVTAGILLPWAMRNHSVLDAWIWTTTNSGFTLYDGFNSAADGSSNQGFVHRMPELASMTETSRNAYLSEKAVDWAKSHPQKSVRLAGWKLARTWSPIPLSSEFGRLRYVLVGAAYSVPLFVMVVLGLFSGQLNWRQKSFLLLPAIYFSVSHAASVGSLRYRIPVEPALAVLAASVVSTRATANSSPAVSDGLTASSS